LTNASSPGGDASAPLIAEAGTMEVALRALIYLAVAALQVWRGAVGTCHAHDGLAWHCHQ